jgi:hypothetical protein
MKRITFICMVLLVGVCAAFVPPAVAQHEHPAGNPSKLGKVNFPWPNLQCHHLELATGTGSLPRLAGNFGIIL